jgi:hypothetical protein
MAALGPDGASHEGVGYWEYGVEYLLKFMDLARELLETDLYQHEWWKQTAAYAQYLTLPRKAWTRGNCIVDLADCPRGHWYGPEYLLRGLARAFGDGHAQWLAQQAEEADVTSPGAAWLNLVWLDPAVAPRAPAELPTLRHFADMGIVSARSDWSGDESQVVFKCGPFIGHEAVQAFGYDPGGGHVHPDANHFVVFAQGEWLVRDDGYRAKWTGQHNSLLVDGQGQLGEGRMWFDGSQLLRVKARPRILRVESNPQFDYMAGDAKEAYPKALGLRRCVRHLFFLKPDALIVCDDVAVDQSRDLELRFHPENPLTGREGRAFLFQTKRSALRLEPLTPDQAEITAENVAAADRHGDSTQQMFAVRMRHKGQEWRNAVALTWSSAGKEPPKVTLTQKEDAWLFSAGERTAQLDWRERE